MYLFILMINLILEAYWIYDSVLPLIIIHLFELERHAVSNIYNQRVLSIEVSRNLALGSHMTENKNKVLFDTEREAV